MNNYYNKLKIYIEKLRANLQYDWRNIEVTFILSTGRTGTKFFGDFFTREFPESVFSIHEPSPDFLKKGVYFQEGKLSKGTLANQLKFHRSLICKKIESKGQSIYVESNNNLSIIIPVLKDVFPNSKIVFITRNPKDYLKSALNKIHGKGEKPYRLFSENDSRIRLTADCLKNDFYYGKWEKMTRFEKICWHWRTYNEIILSNEENWTFLHLRYEDIFGGDEAYAQKLIQFVGINSDCINSIKLKELLSKRANSSKSNDYQGYEGWSSAEKAIFHEMTDNTSEKLGYRS